MAISVDSSATTVFSTCELIIMDTVIFFGDDFEQGMAELLPTGFLHDLSTR